MIAIACRVLGSALGDMHVELFAPETRGEDVACAFRIVGPRTSFQSHATGVDGFQALQLAFEKIAATPRSTEEFAAGGLRWLDSDAPAFALPPSLADLDWRYEA